MSGEYQCSLSATSIEKAKKELNEDPDERQGAVNALREWTEREPWITSPTDARFLLAFLRVGKFSQLNARERLANFLSKSTGSFSFLGHDPGDPKSLEILRDCSMYILPERDRLGRPVICGKVSAIDTSGRYSYGEFTRAFYPLIHSTVFFDENVQVNGLCFFIDFADVHMDMMTWVGLDGWKQAAEYGNKSAPARIQSLNYYNTGPVFEAFINVFKPLLAEKIRNRVHIHHSMVSVYEEIGESVLPEAYLPDDFKGPSAGQIKDIVGIVSESQTQILPRPIERAENKIFKSYFYSLHEELFSRIFIVVNTVPIFLRNPQKWRRRHHSGN